MLLIKFQLTELFAKVSQATPCEQDSTCTYTMKLAHANDICSNKGETEH
jgi:hypothetical protein